MMYDSETRWFIRCDTCPDDIDAAQSNDARNKDRAAEQARIYGWDVRDGLHRCPSCVREGRMEMVK